MIYRVIVKLTPKEFTCTVETLACVERSKTYVLEDPSLFRSRIRKSELSKVQEGITRDTHRSISRECYCLEGDVDRISNEMKTIVYGIFVEMYNNITGMYEASSDEMKRLYKIRKGITDD